MIDVSPQVVSKLNEIGLKVYLENFLDKDTEVPCISYREYGNNSYMESDIIGFSNLVNSQELF